MRRFLSNYFDLLLKFKVVHAVILQIIESPYFNKKSPDLDEIWYTNADLELGESFFSLISSMQGRQQLSCPVLRPPSGPRTIYTLHKGNNEN